MSEDEELSSVYLTSDGLPVLTLEKLKEKEDEDYAARLDEIMANKPWTHCVTCGKPAKLACARCKKYMNEDPTRYCSEACQKNDWPEHRKKCRDTRHRSRFEAKLSAYVDVDYNEGRQLARQIRRWIEALQTTIDWAAQQAFLLRPPNKRQDFCLQLFMDPVDDQNELSTLFTSRFAFKARNWQTMRRGLPIEFTGLHNLAPVEIYVRGENLYLHKWVALKQDEEEANDGLYHEWPWILNQCALMGDISPFASGLRRGLLNVTVRNILRELGKAGPFQVDETVDDFRISRQSMTDWMNLMYPVTAGIRSFHRLPCDFVDRKFGHLMLPFYYE